jgi:PAT family beta-lactamase induction signal transducer AmpG
MRRTSGKYAFFALLYFLQGATLAYIVNFQKPYLSSQGISNAMLGLYTSTLLVPFILKVFLGMLSDRVPLGRWGGRKPYMIVGLLLFAACYASATRIVPRESFTLFWITTWFASLGLALFDTCADGWAIDVSEESEQSAVQASMVAGKSLGLITMSLVFGWIAMMKGIGPIFILLSAMAVMITGVVLLVPSPVRAVAVPNARTSWSALLDLSFVFFALYGVFYSVASFGTDGLMTLQLAQERLAGPLEIGTFGVARGLGSLLGAGFFARLTRLWDLKRTQILALVLLGAGCWLPTFPTLSVVWMGLLWGAAWGFQETAYVTLSMRMSEGPWAATFFAICMIFSNLGTSLGEIAGGQLVPRWGFDSTFITFAVIAWLCVLGSRFLFTSTVRQSSR